MRGIFTAMPKKPSRSTEQMNRPTKMPKSWRFIPRTWAGRSIDL